jgi:exopolysaccharide production protein ExoQ
MTAMTAMYYAFRRRYVDPVRALVNRCLSVLFAPIRWCLRPFVALGRRLMRPVGAWARRHLPPTRLVYIAMGALAVVAACGAIALSGTKTGVALALMAVLGPVALYYALVAPIIFPFSLFVLLIPFDNLLQLPAFGTLTKLFAAVSAAAIIVWLLRTRKYVIPSRPLLFWGAYACFQILSISWALDSQLTAQRLLTPIELFALYAAISFLPIDAKMMRVVIGASIAGAAIAGAYGYHVFHSGNNIAGGGRLFLANDQTLIDPNHFAAALISPFGLGLTAFVSTRSNIVRVLSIMAIGAMALGFAVASSRGALIGMAIMFVYMVCRSPKRLLLGGMGVAGMACGLAVYGRVLQRFANAASTGGAGRSGIWHVGFAAFKDHWLNGAGYGNFPVAYDQAFLRVSESYYTQWHRDPHNIIIGTSVEVGIIGLGLMLMGWFVQFRALRFIGPDHRLFQLRIAIEGSILGLFVSGMFLDIMTQKYLWIIFIISTLVHNLARGPARAPVVNAYMQARSWRFG